MPFILGRFKKEMKIGNTNSSSLSDKIILIENKDIDNISDIIRLEDAILLGLCSNGELRIDINMKEQVLDKDSFIAIGPGSFFQVQSHSDDCRFHLVVISKELILETIDLMSGLFNLAFSLHSAPLIKLTNDNQLLLLNYYNIISHHLQNDNGVLSYEIVKRAATALCVELYSIFGTQLNDYNKKINHRDEITVRFIKDVSEHYRLEKNIEFYASRQGLTPKYLSHICKETSGKYASEWIDTFIMAEARILLRSTNLTIQQIAYHFHFSDQSSFGKYFKLLEGCSPKEYRKRRQL